MKQYLLIELSEIDSRIKELGHLMKVADDNQALEEFSNKRDECFNLKQKGEIVEIEDKNITTELFHSTRPFGESIGEFIEKQGFKLIKTIKQ